MIQLAIVPMMKKRRNKPRLGMEERIAVIQLAMMKLKTKKIYSKMYLEFDPIGPFVPIIK